MDSTGSDKARDLARALTSLGQPLSYVMTGGFKAWAAAELPVVEDEVEYDASTGAVLSDNVEVLAERATEAVKTVSQPQVCVHVAGSSVKLLHVWVNPLSAPSVIPVQTRFHHWQRFSIVAALLACIALGNAVGSASHLLNLPLC